MSDNRRSSCIWFALAMGEDQLLPGLDSSDFNWRDTHKRYGTPLHAVLFKGRDSGDDNSDLIVSDKSKSGAGADALFGQTALRLALLRKVVEKGADPYLAAPASFKVSSTWRLNGKNGALIRYGGFSVIECLLAHKQVIQQFGSDKDFKLPLEAIAQALEILCSSRAQPSGPKISVMDEIVETWESVLADHESADVVIRVQQGGGDAEEVPAHSLVLAKVSPVLKAMLQSGMRESSRKEIVVADCKVEAVRLFLSLAYTGSFSGDEEAPELDVIVQAMGLSHRWLARHVVQMLAEVLARDLNERSFEPVTDIAMRLQLPALLATCRSYTLSNPRAMKARLKADSGSAALQNVAVRAEVGRLLHDEAESETPQKRRRRAL